MITSKRPANRTVDIMGNKWNIIWKTEKEDVRLINCDGYCDETIKTIVIEWYEWDGRNKNNMGRYAAKVLRHELIHAMLYEAGLGINSHKEWAVNEEMVDWFAIQLPRMCNDIMPLSDAVCEEIEKDYTIID